MPAVEGIKLYVSWSANKTRMCANGRRLCLFVLLLAGQFQPVLCADLAELRTSVLRAHSSAQESVQQEWNPVLQLACRLPTLFGLVDKVANGSSIASLHSNMDGESWSQYHTALVPIYGSPTVVISWQFKFIYVWHPKTSSSRVMEALQTTFCEEEECKKNEIQQVHPHLIDDDIWTTFLVFTFVRNPWRRLSSIYRMVTSRFLHTRILPEGCAASDNAPRCNPTVGAACSVPFMEFTRNTRVLRMGCETANCCAYMPLEKTWNSAYLQTVVNDQSTVVFTPDGGSRVDFIGRAERMQEDWVELMQVIRDRSRDAFIPAAITDHKAADQSMCNLTQLESQFNSTSLWNIGQQYALDVHRFGYLHGELFV